MVKSQKLLVGFDKDQQYKKRDRDQSEPNYYTCSIGSFECISQRYLCAYCCSEIGIRGNIHSKGSTSHRGDSSKYKGKGSVSAIESIDADPDNTCDYDDENGTNFVF